MISTCDYCGSSRNVTWFGNRPTDFMVTIGVWPKGRALSGRCVGIENRRALQGKRSPRLAARILRRLRALTLVRGS